jgi:purine-cytosine permease-like protein
MLLPFIPQFVWIIITTGITIAVLLFTVNFLHFLAPIGWFLIIIITLLALAFVISKSGKIITYLRAMFNRNS